MDVDVPQQPPRATFKLRIPRFSAFARTDRDAFSDRRSVGGFDWSIWGSINRRGGKNFFAYYLACYNETSDNWAVKATFRLGVKNSKRADSECKKTVTFASWPQFKEAETVGDGEILTVEDILQHGSGFVQNDAVTVVCQLAVHPTRCPVFDGLRSIRHLTHDVTLVIDGERVNANKGDILQRGSGFLQNDAVTVVCQLSVHPTRCPVFDGLRSIRHPTHDVTLVIDGERVHANKGLLSSFSAYFAELFYGDNRQNLDEIILEDVDFVSWCRFFIVVYTGDDIVSCDYANILKLVPLARRFGVQSLLFDFDDYVRNGHALDPIDRLMAAEALEDAELLDAIVDAFSREQLLEVALSPDLNKLDVATAEKLAAKLQQVDDH